MKQTLLILCSALAFVGCDQNRGGAGSDTDMGTGSSSSRDSSYQSGSQQTDRNTISGNSLPGTNSASTTTNNSAVTPSIPDSGAGASSTTNSTSGANSLSK